MASKKIGRRNFIKGASTAVLGLAAAPLGQVDSAFAKGGHIPPPEFRTLGKTGLKVTAVGMGVMNCSDPAVLRRAFDIGVNFYDTAHVYMSGRNEDLVGKVFQGKRDKVLIQTKIRFGSSEKENRATLETSLKRLRTDYVDVLLAHSLKTANEVCTPALIEFMQAVKKEGKARFTGFSTHSGMASLLNAATKAGCHDVALVSYNFTHGKELKEAIAAAAKAGIGVVAMKTQAGGYKSAKIGGLNPHQAALRYVLNDRNVATAVPGVTTIEQINQCAAVTGTAISGGEADDLRQYGAFLHGRVCTMCGACTGQCPQGTAHTDLLRVALYNDGYGDYRLAKEVFDAPGFADKLKRCSDCSSCAVTCRRGLDIQAAMESIYRSLA